MLECPLLSEHSIEESKFISHRQSTSSFDPDIVRFPNGLSLEWKTIDQLSRSDITTLHETCLPVRYDESFYEALVDGSTSLLALSEKNTGQLIGVITSQTRTASQNEDCSGVCSLNAWGEECALTYILTLCVVEQHRKIGIASTLLRKLIEKCVRGEPGYTVKKTNCPRHSVLVSCLNLQRDNTTQSCRCKKVSAIYLHVLSSNIPAIYFYENHKFEKMKFYRNYYLIDSRPLHAFVYAIFVNGGRPPTHFIHRLSYAFEWTEYVIGATLRFIRSFFRVFSDDASCREGLM